MKMIVLLNGECLGQGTSELGAQLMGSFLRKLWMVDHKPDAIIFYNSAVKLLSEGSQVLDALDGLSKAGVDLIACGTCTSYFQLDDSLHVGRISNMQEIISIIMNAQKVVTP